VTGIGAIVVTEQRGALAVTKFDVDPSGLPGRPSTGGATTATPAPLDPGGCDLYAPGHLLHYTHQGKAVRTAGRAVVHASVEATEVTLVLGDGAELHWRHHDPVRLSRILELVPVKRLAYPDGHALRVGPYWFNCATEDDHWQDCRSGESHRA
jgi:hypothetical protein